MSLQQDNAFKSPWKSTSPTHMWVLLSFELAEDKPCSWLAPSTAPTLGLDRSCCKAPRWGSDGRGGSCLQVGPPKPRADSITKRLGVCGPATARGMGGEDRCKPTLLRGDDLSISVSDPKAVLASFWPCCGPQGLEINPGRVL